MHPVNVGGNMEHGKMSEFGLGHWLCLFAGFVLGAEALAVYNLGTETPSSIPFFLLVGVMAWVSLSIVFAFAPNNAEEEYAAWKSGGGLFRK
jgi:drug/metabolite transporter (DMT)-like permease